MTADLDTPADRTLRRTDRPDHPVSRARPRCDDERHWLRAAPRLVGHLFPRLPAQRRSGLFGYAGYGYCPSHSRWYWGAKLLIICTCDGTVTGFSLANPKLHGERDQARQTLERQPANRPAPGTAVVTDKGLARRHTAATRDDPALVTARRQRRLLANATQSLHVDAEPAPFVPPRGPPHPEDN